MVKVSVIIPVYNVENYLKECIDSIVNQTLEDIEIICVNDGSTDSSLDILNLYDDKRITVINQENQGLSASRNAGLDIATGEYVCFLDSDDYLILTALEELYDLAQSKSLDMVMFKLRNFDDDTREELEFPYFEMIELKEIVKDSVFSFKDVEKPMFFTSVTAPGKLFKHELVEDVRFPVGLIFEDNPFFTEAMLGANRIQIYDKYLYFRRVRQGSITNSTTERYTDWLEISDLLIEITKRHGVYEEYAYIVYNKKFSNTFKLFLDMVDEEDRPYFFEKLKENFKDFGEKYKNDNQFINMNSRLKFIYNAGLDCETAKEFEYTIKNYDLKHANKRIRKSNRKLNEEIEEYEKINDIILNSTSWKTTRPLRKFADLVKENK